MKIRKQGRIALISLCIGAFFAALFFCAQSSGGGGAEGDASIEAAAQNAFRDTRTHTKRDRHTALVYDIHQGKILAADHEKDADTEAFSPGSLMKVPVLFWLLASGGIEARHTYTCAGRFYPRGESPARDELIHEDVREPLPGQWYKCSAQKGHGNVSPVRAVAHSCNLFFLSLAGRLTGDDSALRAFAEFCARYGLLRAARQLPESAEMWCTRDRLHLALGLPVRVSVYEIARCFSLLLDGAAGDGQLFKDPERVKAARRVILEGMREASRDGTARAIGLHAGEALLAKTGSGLASPGAEQGGVFTLNGWCVTAWPSGKRPRVVFVSFVHNSYGAGLPLEYSRHFWEKFFGFIKD